MLFQGLVWCNFGASLVQFRALFGAMLNAILGFAWSYFVVLFGIILGLVWCYLGPCLEISRALFRVILESFLRETSNITENERGVPDDTDAGCGYWVRHMGMVGPKFFSFFYKHFTLFMGNFFINVPVVISSFCI